jgi:hypothetical protein
MRTRLTERDLSRIVRRVIKEQETNFCEEAEYNEQQALDHLNVLQDVKNMVKKYDEIIPECDLDNVVIFTMMFSKIVNKWEQLLQLDIDGIDMEEYIKHLKDKYNI